MTRNKNHAKRIRVGYALAPPPLERADRGHYYPVYDPRDRHYLLKDDESALRRIVRHDPRLLSRCLCPNCPQRVRGCLYGEPLGINELINNPPSMARIGAIPRPDGRYTGVSARDFHKLALLSPDVLENRIEDAIQGFYNSLNYPRMTATTLKELYLFNGWKESEIPADATQQWDSSRDGAIIMPPLYMLRDIVSSGPATIFLADLGGIRLSSVCEYMRNISIEKDVFVYMPHLCFCAVKDRRFRLSLQQTFLAMRTCSEYHLIVGNDQMYLPNSRLFFLNLLFLSEIRTIRVRLFSIGVASYIGESLFRKMFLRGFNPDRRKDFYAGAKAEFKQELTSFASSIYDHYKAVLRLNPSNPENFFDTAPDCVQKSTLFDAWIARRDIDRTFDTMLNTFVNADRYICESWYRFNTINSKWFLETERSNNLVADCDVFFENMSFARMDAVLYGFFIDFFFNQKEPLNESWTQDPVFVDLMLAVMREEDHCLMTRGMEFIPYDDAGRVLRNFLAFYESAGIPGFVNEDVVARIKKALRIGVERDDLIDMDAVSVTRYCHKYGLFLDMNTV